MSQTVSIIIPSHGRSAKLQRLIDSIAVQDLPAQTDLEVIVIIDGEGSEPAFPPGMDARATIVPFGGASRARNEGIAQAAGEILIFLNDDVVLAEGFLVAHINAIRSGHRAAVGYSPWKPPTDPKFFDAFIARTPSIFDQSGLVACGLHGFRSAWTLNFSIDRSVLKDVTAPFHPDLRPVYFEDLEFAYRCLGRSPVIYHEPNAVAVHDHRVTISDYFQREILMGMMSAVLHSVNPDCHGAIFPIEPRPHAQAASPMLDLDARDHRRILEDFLRRAARAIETVDAVDGEAAELYALHLPIKRRAFRLGLIAETSGAGGIAWDGRITAAARIMRDDAVLSVIEQLPPASKGVEQPTSELTQG